MMRRHFCCEVNNGKIYNRHLAQSFDLNIARLWDVSFDSHEFTFIDLIKGIVPLSLSAEINHVIINSQVTTQLLSVYLDKKYNYLIFRCLWLLSTLTFT